MRPVSTARLTLLHTTNADAREGAESVGEAQVSCRLTTASITNVTPVKEQSRLVKAWSLAV